MLRQCFCRSLSQMLCSSRKHKFSPFLDTMRSSCGGCIVCVRVALMFAMIKALTSCFFVCLFFAERRGVVVIKLSSFTQANWPSMTTTLSKSVKIEGAQRDRMGPILINSGAGRVCLSWVWKWSWGSLCSEH